MALLSAKNGRLRLNAGVGTLEEDTDSLVSLEHTGSRFGTPLPLKRSPESGLIAFWS